MFGVSYTKDMEEKVCELIKSIVNDDFKIITNETIISDLKLNSLEFITLIVSIEAEFNFEFDDKYLNQEQFYSVQDIIQYVRNKTT